uniref:Uncharacterized protein n=1 Tax=Dulem virus 36 TaxID=3145754 RepID=A0AAU8B027_9CAUD
MKTFFRLFFKDEMLGVYTKEEIKQIMNTTSDAIFMTTKFKDYTVKPNRVKESDGTYTVYCCRCYKPFTSSSVRETCDTCRERMYRERTNSTKQSWRKKQKIKAEEERKRIAERTKGKTLSEIQKAAQERGMSYGQYVAYMYSQNNK